MSQTTISIDVAFNRIWTLAVSMERGTKQKRLRLHFEKSLSYGK